jgi:hypothetical protein
MRFSAFLKYLSVQGPPGLIQRGTVPSVTSAISENSVNKSGLRTGTPLAHDPRAVVDRWRAGGGRAISPPWCPLKACFSRSSQRYPRSRRALRICLSAFLDPADLGASPDP